MDIVLVVAIAQNGVIGAGDGLPWRLSSDLRRFRAVTMGKPVIMGRKTWDTIGKPLPGRANIVISRDAGFTAEGAEVVRSLEEALELAEERARELDGAGEICVIGGGQIYARALPLADRLYVTHVLASPPGDTFFPPIDENEWQPVSREEVPAGERDSAPMLFVTYERRRGPSSHMAGGGDKKAP